MAVSQKCLWSLWILFWGSLLQHDDTTDVSKISPKNWVINIDARGAEKNLDVRFHQFAIGTSLLLGPPWWSSGEQTAIQGRRHRSDPRSGSWDPHTSLLRQLLSLHTRTREACTMQRRPSTTKKNFLNGSSLFFLEYQLSYACGSATALIFFPKF